jgi:hypothetical protein
MSNIGHGTTAHGRAIKLGNYALGVAFSGSECLFGLSWSIGAVMLHLGPFQLAWITMPKP